MKSVKFKNTQSTMAGTGLTQKKGSEDPDNIMTDDDENNPKQYKSP